MKKRIKKAGMMLGTTLMITAAAAAPAFAAKTTPKTQKDNKAALTVQATQAKENKAQGTGAKSGTDIKQQTPYYGKIIKIAPDKLTLDSATVVWEKGSEADKKDAGNGANQQADFETASMKWKMDKKSNDIIIGKDTIFVKQKATDGEKADQKKESDTKDQKANDGDKGTALIENIKGSDIKEGDWVRVFLKNDGSGTASEVMVLTGVSEVKAKA